MLYLCYPINYLTYLSLLIWKWLKSNHSAHFIFTFSIISQAVALLYIVPSILIDILTQRLYYLYYFTSAVPFPHSYQSLFYSIVLVHLHLKSVSRSKFYHSTCDSLDTLIWHRVYKAYLHCHNCLLLFLKVENVI